MMMLLAQCTALAASPAAASLAASPAPERAHTRTYLALDERNVADAGGAELVLGPVTKTHSALIAEEEPWEMRFDNMQPNVWYDDGKWRAWYSTFSTCDGRMPGPNHNASDEPDCQALQSSCNLTAPKPKPKPPPPPDLAAAAPPPPPKVKKGRNGLFLYAESAEATPSRPFVKPALGLFPWPPQSSNTSNNIFLNLGDCAGGGCGTGITLDHDSPTANFSRFKWFGSGSNGPNAHLTLAESYTPFNLSFRNFHNYTYPEHHGRLDTHKNVVWDAATQKWVGYLRCTPSIDRVECWTESSGPDFTTATWSEPVPTGLNTSSGNYQPDAMVVFQYEGVWIGFANVFNPMSYYNGKGMPPYDSVGATPVGTVNTVLTWSPDARNWRYIQPDRSFVPRGSTARGDFDCCGIFMAKQNPALTPAFASGSDTLPVFYTGCNGAFFGPRACALGSVAMKRHGFAGLKGPANVTATWQVVADGSFKVTATGGVRAGVIGKWYGTELCTPIDGVEVPVVWKMPPARPGKKPPKPLPAGKPLDDPDNGLVGGAVGLVFEVPAGAVLYAWHL